MWKKSLDPPDPLLYCPGEVVLWVGQGAGQGGRGAGQRVELRYGAGDREDGRAMVEDKREGSRCSRPGEGREVRRGWGTGMGGREGGGEEQNKGQR